MKLSVSTIKEIEDIDQIFLFLIDFTRKNIIEESIKNELSYPQFKILITLFFHNPTSINKIIEEHFLSNSTCTVLLDKLESLGLIERKRDSKNRRLVNVSITDAGIDMINKITAKRHDFFDDIFSKMTENEKYIVKTGMAIFAKSIQSIKAVQ